MDPDTPTDPVLEALDSLADLFRRRLLDDKDKRRAFDVLYEQLEHSKSQVDGTLLRPLALDCIRVIDRLDQYRGDDREFVRSLREELFESLHRVRIEPIPNALNQPFNPATQEVAEIRESDAGEPDGTVLGWVRRGYIHGDQVIRPTLVVVAGNPGSTEPEHPSPTTEPALSEDHEH